ncbi:phycobilisome rod-core linker polypeptide CpcG2 (Lrc) [Synechococcus sp. RS9909]|uniref:phycobilisome rod-core linker polypeptide n=1 Tax=unclassified Synechococcus TaxID=2626047 RepID=UPI0000690910|nr:MULTISPECIES: phycobilisome rod-core linker polypeptide [unclassified Synechococcus]EAQ68488.1 putative phycobilisome rod-core linker polypeptide (L-RC 28.5) [Synechococcus sp. RS9917]QNI78599.1 phycobilisome rod-core linker polypeptide CpcG2 (Lrc) [Synechococcus sp. RS9909]
MVLPLLSTPIRTQNALVTPIGSVGDESDRRCNQGLHPQKDCCDLVIEQAYRQVFFHPLKVDRQPMLEMKLRDGGITVRDFMRGLLTSQRFRDGYLHTNSNNRLVDHLISKALGRQPHGQAERIALSILIAEQGLNAAVDTLLNSSEYLEAFGYDSVPHQRNRVLAGRAQGEKPTHQRLPRYAADWRDSSAKRFPANPAGASGTAAASWTSGQPPAWALRLWLGLAVVGGLEIGRVLLTIAGSMLSTSIQ